MNHQIISAITLALLLPIAARAQTFTEDFSDPNAFAEAWFPIGLGDPEDLLPWQPGILDISEGNLRTQTTNPVPLSMNCPLGDRTCWDTGNNGTTGVAWLPSLAEPIADVSVRTKVRINTVTNAAIAVRANLETFSNYNFTAAGAEGTFALSRFNNGVMDRVEFFDEGPALNVGDDWWMEGSAMGDQLTLKVWKVGEQEPADAQFSWTDDLLSSGGVALAGTVHNNVVPAPTLVDATFDDVSITVIPESSAGIGMAGGFIGIAVLRRHRKN